MIIGSGLIARSFLSRTALPADVCIYAAGVSNSFCTDASEFRRDRERLEMGLSSAPRSVLFIYFSTCSIDDPSSQGSKYVQHKRELEDLVRERNRYLVVRLPQTAGFTPNPHTLLNYLYARISRSERFDVWRSATRNVIDVDDVARLVLDLAFQEYANNETINVANTHTYTMFEIVAAIEKAADHKALYNVIDRGAPFTINASRIAASIERCRIRFDEHYLLRTVQKYYGEHSSLRP